MYYHKQYQHKFFELRHQQVNKDFCGLGHQHKEKVRKDIDDIVFKKDKEGNIILNKHGLPKINWLGILLQIGKLIALYVHQRYL